MKCDTSEPDFPKVGNELFYSCTKILNNLCKPLPIIFCDSSATFDSHCVCLIRSHILNLASLLLSYVWIRLPSQISLRSSILIYPSSQSYYVDDS